MSKTNIIKIQPVFDVGPFPLAVEVTFRVHGPEGTRTYRYSTFEAVRGILNGEDPAQWTGERIK